jgi:Uma2 family endonuclease
LREREDGDMTMLIENPPLEEEIIRERRSRGIDQHDEVWDGIYFMTPIANNEHQIIVGRFTSVLDMTVGIPGLGIVLPGANLAVSTEDWKHDYRVPDVVVFLNSGTAENHDTHWTGAADFVVEITSSGDRTYEKIPFYSRLGVRELLIVNRESWSVELYRWQNGGLEKVGQSSADASEVLRSNVVPLEFRLLPGQPQPQVEIVHPASQQRWTI